MPVGTFTQTDGTTNINNILTQEANRIGQDIYKQTLHVSPWIDLIPKAKFMDGMGYTQNTLVYDRTLPTYGGASNQDNVGLQWTSLAGSVVADNTNLNSQALIAGASVDRLGPQDAKSYIDFTRKLKSFNLKRAVIESPRINVDDLRFAAYRAEQLRAVTELLKESSRYCWEERYRDEYDRLADNLVVAKATGTVVTTGQEGIQTEAIDPDANTAALTPTANISNKITDKIYNILQRAGAGTDAYGRENGRAVFGLVLSSEASYALMTESGFRDDVRYSARVDELIAPLGVEKSFRGWYHLIDDLAPRFNISGSAPNQDLVRVPAYTISSGVIIPNTAYETATYEAAYVLHKSVMESQIPEPITSAGNGITFNPVNYRGEFKWTNIPNADINPDGTIGFFRGVLTSASKPIKTNFGYVFLFDRTSTTPAA